ncbi:unannotated protein [freshwater metagenome]|uniref:Unannotated protein n=1 Tax=freshwater metagenome TaxID=449393 RepID=A0A6J7J3C6_9ZZZZ
MPFTRSMSKLVGDSVSVERSHAPGSSRCCETHLAMSVPGHGVSRSTTTGTPAFDSLISVRFQPARHSCCAAAPDTRSPLDRLTSESVWVLVASTRLGLSDPVESVRSASSAAR